MVSKPAPVVPWAALAVRAYLIGHPRVPDGWKVATRSPSDVGPLHVVVQAPNASGLDRPRHGLHRPLVLVEARAATASEAGGDPEADVMAAAAVLSSVLCEATNVLYKNARWSALRATGAFALPVDETRGVPVYRGATQAELALHARTTT